MSLPYLFRFASQSTLNWTNVVIVAETDFSLSSRHSLTFCAKVSRSFLILSQLRLETIYLIQDIHEVCTIKSNNFGKSATYSSSALMIKYMLSKLGSRRMLVKISDKVTQAFASSKSVLPA